MVLPSRSHRKLVERVRIMAKDAKVHIWSETFTTPAKASISDYKGKTVGLVVRGAKVDEDGGTKAVTVDIYNGAGAPQSVTVTQSRIITQLARLSEAGTDRTVAAVVQYGKRGVVLAPP